MAYATAKYVKSDTIPVIDLTSLRDDSDTSTVAAALHAASQNLGFIYVKGHGISATSIDQARDAAFRFFRSTDAKKSTVQVSRQHRGWLKPGSAKMHDGAKADLKESYIWGHQALDGSTHQDHPLRGPNQWPEFVSDLQPAAMNYFEQVHRVAFELMRGFAVGLDLDEDFFLKNCDRPLSRASFVYYPAQDEDCGEKQFGVAPHTDFGVLTILCQDDTGGLQVQDIKGDWLHATPIDGTLVVNVGDLLSRWTAGEYKSTPHRVVNNSGRERMSIVLAFDPNPETVIDAKEIYGDTNRQCEESITRGDYLLWRFAKAFSYRC